MKRASRLALLLVVVLVAVLMLIPNTALAFLRSEYLWLGQLGRWVDRLWPGVDAGHLLAFGALGLLGALAWPRMGFGAAVVLLAALAIATEVLQFWVPGRTPRTGDVIADLGGGMLGFLVARVAQLGGRVARGAIQRRTK